MAPALVADTVLPDDPAGVASDLAQDWPEATAHPTQPSMKLE